MNESAIDLDRVKKITTVALHRAIAGDLEDAAQYMARLNGSPGLVRAIMMLADTYIGHVWPEHRLGQPVQLAWFNVDDQAAPLETANEVRPSLRWAGRIIGARAADDEAGFMALLETPAEGFELGNAVMALVGIVAASVGNLDKVRAKAAEVGTSNVD